MKKVNLKVIFAALVLLPAFAGAQGMYVDVSVGYGFPFNTSSGMLTQSTTVETVNYDLFEFRQTGTEEKVALSLGKGVNFGATFGYIFTPYLGAELQISYLAGGSTETSSSYQLTEIMGGVSKTYTSTYNQFISANQLRFIPTIVLTAGLQKINPYAKVGLIIGTGKVNFNLQSNEAGERETKSYKMNGGAAFGLSTRMGIVYKFDERMSYFAEVQIVNMNYKPTDSELIEYTVNGVDELGNLTTREKLIRFVDELSYDSDEEPLNNKPSKALQIHMPFSSVGINVGVRIAI